MNRDDFVKLVGVASGDDQYVPVAFLLSNGYACAGFYHATINKGLAGACVLLNARLIDLRAKSKASGQPHISEFNDFLEEITVNFCEPSGKDGSSPRTDTYGKTIPLMAVPFEQVAIVYPIAHIGELMRRAEQKKIRPHRFLDLNKCEIINLLRTKLW